MGAIGTSYVECPRRVMVSGTDSRLILRNKTFANCQRNAKFTNVFIREKKPAIR